MLPKCAVASFPAAKIVWTKITVPDLHPRMRDISDGQLSIVNVHKEDSVFYQCRATNKIGVTVAITHLVVVDDPVITVRPPPQLSVNHGQTVSLRCEAGGEPKHKVSWLKENGALPLGRSNVSINGTLKLWKWNLRMLVNIFVWRLQLVYLQLPLPYSFQVCCVRPLS